MYERMMERRQYFVSFVTDTIKSTLIDQLV